MSLKLSSQTRYREVNNLLNERDMVDVGRLILLLKAIISYLKNDGSGEGSYAYLRKAINILENKSINGMANINMYVMSDLRMMFDRGQYGDDIDIITNEVTSIIKKNPLFDKEKS